MPRTHAAAQYLHLDPHNGKNYMCVMNDGCWQGFFHNQHVAGKIKASGMDTTRTRSLEDAQASKVAPCIAEMQLDMQQQLHERVQEVKIAYQEQAEADKAAAEQVLSNSLDEAGRTLQNEFRSLEQLLRRKGQDRHTEIMTDSAKRGQGTVVENETTTRQLVQSYSSLALGMIKEHRKRLERLRRLVVRNLEAREAEPEITYVPAEGRQVRLSLSTALAMSPFFPGFGHMRRLQQSPQYRLGMSLGLSE